MEEKIETKTIKPSRPKSVILTSREEYPLFTIEGGDEEKMKSISSKRTTIHMLTNRLMICVFAVCLLWLTSLQMCVLIVESALKAPDITQIIDDCQYAYDITNDQRNDYSDCAESQMDKCNANLAISFASALADMNTKESANSYQVKLKTSQQLNCTSTYANFKASLNAWSSQGVSYQIHYQNNCTGSRLKTAKDLIGDDTTSESSTYSEAVVYADKSDSTISKMASYAVDLSDYNVRYVDNKTQSLQDLAVRIASKVDPPEFTVSLDAIFNNLHKVFSTVVACVSMDNETTTVDNTCNFGVNARALYDEIQVEMNVQLLVLHNTFKSWDAKFQSYKADVNIALDNAETFYDSVAGASGILNWIQNNFQVTNQLCGRTSPDWCDFSKYSFYVNTPTMPTVPVKRDMPSALYIWNKVKNVIPPADLEFDLGLENCTQKVGRWLNTLQDDISEALEDADFSPKDYHPPSYGDSESGGNNITEDAQESKASSSSFKENIAVTLSGGNQKPNVTSTRNFSYASFKASALNSYSSYSSTWEDFSKTDLKLQDWITGLLALRNLFFLADYFYRALSTVRTVRKYFKRGIVNLPTLDFRSKVNEFKYVPSLAMMQAFLYMIPLLWIQIFVTIIFVIVIVYVITAIYIPFYHDYVHFCVLNKGGNGTIISKHMYEAAYNYAAAEGNRINSRGVTKYNSKLTSYCTENSANSASRLDQAVQAVKDANITIIENSRNVATLVQCVDVDVMDSLFMSSCCSYVNTRSNEYVVPAYYEMYCGDDVGASDNDDSSKCPVSDTKQLYLPPGYYVEEDSSCVGLPSTRRLMENSTDDSVGELEGLQDSRFDCEALPECKTSCDGPSVSIVKVVTKCCACMIEWYINSSTLQFFCAAFVFICLNVARSLLCRGIVILLWRHLTPEIFEFKANCFRDGEMIICPPEKGHKTPVGELCDVDERGCCYPHSPNNEMDLTDVNSQATATADPVKEKSEDSKSDRSALVDLIERAIVVFERTGVFLICGAVLINIPWIVCLQVLKNNLQYDPNA